MAVYGAIPARFGEVHPRYKTPGFATLVMGATAIGFYLVLSLISTNALADSIASLGLAVAFYYGITAFACVVYFRRTLFTQRPPLLPPRAASTARRARDGASPSSWRRSSSSTPRTAETSFGPLGGIFVIGIGMLALGVPLMIACAVRLKAVLPRRDAERRHPDPGARHRRAAARRTLIDDARPAAEPVVGVLLAAGAGRRAGGPKALRVDPDGTSWLLRSIAVLRDGGCAEVVVVLGSQADRARDLIARRSSRIDRHLVDAPDWAQGMGSSLRAGLLAVQQRPGSAALVHLVDLPDVTAEVVRRLLQEAPPDPSALARATYGGRPGHPVLIGRDHLPAVIDGLSGDSGARDYLAQHAAHGVECGDLASGRDRDE